MSKKIALIVGAYPPDACGIGDYSYQLVHSDIDKWICIIWKEWNLTGLLKLIRKIKKLDTVYVNLQYPTKSSYGSLMPHLLCIYFSLFTNKRYLLLLFLDSGRRPYLRNNHPPHRYQKTLFLI